MRFRATHDTARGAAVMVYVPSLFTLDEAARALAVVSPEPPRRFGQNTARMLLQRAAREQLRGEPCPDAVARYRELLVGAGVFTGVR